ncbi:MAG: glutamate--tRNA ligase [Crenarchaeota archaeon]|nr:glutamate--tRNA ligase [Thermoproteota archaeon]
MLKDNKDLRELVRKLAFLNAVQHGGKAQAGSIVGKLLGEKQELRSQVKELNILINEALSEVNSLPAEEQKQIIVENWPQNQEKKKIEEEKHLPPLPNAEKYKQIVTRFSPNPDCVIHLGSARAILLSHEYARIYKGKFILRFEDTDPKVKKPALEFYTKIREDLTWLGCKVDEEYIQSDRIPIYHKYAQQLIQQGNAYICTCIPDEFRKKSIASEACPCRNLPPDEHLQRWNKMLDGSLKEGQAVMRVKTDLAHPNPAVRDWPAFRVIDPERYPHPRVGNKYRAWPLYNMAAGTDDHLMGVTHIIRGKEHLTNGVRQEYMYKYLGWEYPQTIHYGRLKITGAFLSKSKIVAGMKEGTFKEWDDPRLATFAALRKRGITPEAIKKMIIDVGPKPADVTLSWENLYSYNRKILDLQSDRFFFVAEPTILKVKSIPKEFTVKLPKYPDTPERGTRNYTITPTGQEKEATFWIAKKDTQTFETNKMLRLMELFNVRIEKISPEAIEAIFVSESYEEVRKAKAQLIHWIPKGQEYPCEVLMSDASTVKGLCEITCKELKPDTIIQFERFGFVRVDNNTEKIVAYFTQK